MKAYKLVYPDTLKGRKELWLDCQRFIETDSPCLMLVRPWWDGVSIYVEWVPTGTW